MSHVRIAAIALIGLILPTLGAAKPEGSTTQPAKAEPNLQAMVVNQTNRIQQLEAELAASQQREKQLNQQLIIMERQLSVDTQKLQSTPSPKVLPPNWTAKKFNGVDVYLVPCDTAVSLPK